MKQTLQLGLRQQLAMTPQLQQAIRLLQLSTIELQTEIQEVLDSNYMLEMADEGGDEGPPGLNGTATTEPPVETVVDPVDIPKELAVDSAWEDIYEPVTPSAPASASGDNSGFEFESQTSAAETLREHLDYQLQLTDFSPADRLIAEYLVDAIDPDGYLECSLEDVRDLVWSPDDETLADIDVAEVEAVLRQIQNFDPAGVGARDIGECLYLQLRQFPEDTPLLDVAIRIVREGLSLLEARDFDRLQRVLHVDEETLKATIAFIRTLNPRPGSQIATEPSEYIIPDILVTKKDGGWHVELNPDSMPKLRVNPLYASFVKRGDDTADNESLKKHLNEARWFIKSLRSRSETLLKVATSIVERQQGFLEHGPEAMKPMVLHDIADAVSMHESTISRVTTRKYMHTPRGVFELKYFFSSQVATNAGGTASSTAIKALIKKFVEEENPRKPLSDSKLATLLSDAGVKVARRTVAKYREALLITSSSERKRLT